MLIKMILDFILNGFHFILHVTNGSEFPKPLSKKQEDELIEKWSNEHDEAAKSKLIEHNLRLVAHVVKKYNASPFEQEDLISIGTIGLIKAVNCYHSGKETKLSTFAARCIENEILMYFRSKKKTLQDVYMSDPIETDKEGNALTLSDVISDDEDMIDKIDRQIKIKKLREYIDLALNEREKNIIELRYGLNGKKELTQRQVAKLLGISRSYVSRIEKHSLKLLLEQFEQSKNQ